MDNTWKFYTEIDFANENINQYHVDTRDFHCSVNEKKPDPEIGFYTLRKYPERFFHTPEGVVELLTRLFNESGGKKKWRFLSLESTDKRMYNWNMKYIRIHRTDLGLVVCDTNNYALKKDILGCKVNQEHLSAY